MKKIIVNSVVLMSLVLFGFVGYKVAVGIAAEKMISQVSNQILTDAEIEALQMDPAIQELLENETAFNEADLPFHTKEEALKTLTGEFSMAEIKDITSIVQGGLTESEKAEIEKVVFDRLTEEQLEALRLIALKEIKNKE